MGKLEKTNGLRINHHYVYKKGDEYFYHENIKTLNDFFETPIPNEKKLKNVTDQLQELINKQSGLDEHVNYITKDFLEGVNETRTIEIYSGKGG
jgi:hypothetical protein